jgi:hypothetical protein
MNATSSNSGQHSRLRPPPRPPISAGLSSTFSIFDGSREGNVARRRDAHIAEEEIGEIKRYEVCAACVVFYLTGILQGLSRADLRSNIYF